MTLAIISDAHANLRALRAALVDITAKRVDRVLHPGEIVCLGEIVGYNADPSGCIALLRDSGVAGHPRRPYAAMRRDSSGLEARPQPTGITASDVVRASRSAGTDVESRS